MKKLLTIFFIICLTNSIYANTIPQYTTHNYYQPNNYDPYNVYSSPYPQTTYQAQNIYNYNYNHTNEAPIMQVDPNTIPALTTYTDNPIYVRSQTVNQAEMLGWVKAYLNYQILGSLLHIYCVPTVNLNNQCNLDFYMPLPNGWNQNNITKQMLLDLSIPKYNLTSHKGNYTIEVYTDRVKFICS